MRHGSRLGAAPAEALNNAGYIAMMHGDFEIAATLFTRALEASPSLYEPAWRNLQQLQDMRAEPRLAI